MKDDGIVYHAGVRREGTQAFFRSSFRSFSRISGFRDRARAATLLHPDREAEVPANMVYRSPGSYPSAPSLSGTSAPLVCFQPSGPSSKSPLGKQQKVHHQNRCTGPFSLFVDSTNGEHQRTGRIAIMPDIFIAVSGSEEHGTAFPSLPLVVAYSRASLVWSGEAGR